MTVAEWTRIKELFEAALLLPAPERSAFLAAQSEPPILDEVRSLLSVYEDAPGFLEGEAPLPPAIVEQEPAPPAGRRIGSWRPQARDRARGNGNRLGGRTR